MFLSAFLLGYYYYSGLGICTHYLKWNVQCTCTHSELLIASSDHKFLMRE